MVQIPTEQEKVSKLKTKSNFPKAKELVDLKNKSVSDLVCITV